jgi:hypothetical protein
MKQHIERHTLMSMPLGELKALLDKSYAERGLNIDTLAYQRVYSYRVKDVSKTLNVIARSKYGIR